MAWLPNPIACDVCGDLKQPSNNWYFAEIVMPTENKPPVFTLRPWNPLAEDRTKPYIHLCGQACAIKKLDEFMSPVQEKVL